MDQRFFAGWVRATAWGWLAGLVLVIVLAIAWESIAGTAQFMVGAGMGAGVGYFQARSLKPFILNSRRWFWASLLGMTLPFVAWDLGATFKTGVGLSMPACALLGALFTGIAQARFLSARYKKPYLWVPASVLGWGVPVGIMALGDSGRLPGAWSIVSVVAMLLGGVVLGAVTGKALEWMPTAEPLS